jgi:hypothetical protein
MAPPVPARPTLARRTADHLDARSVFDDSRRPTPTTLSRVRGGLHLLTVRWRVGRWAAAVVAGLVAAWVVAGAAAEAESARARWGTTLDVVVARHHLEVGEVITADAVEMISAPARLVPPAALRTEPIGGRVTTRVEPGEILVDHRVTNRPGSAASLTLPEGTRGVVVDRAEVHGEVGDMVELHALISGARLTEGVVVHIDESSVTIAVPRVDVGPLVDAMSQGGLVSVLVP